MREFFKKKLPGILLCLVLALPAWLIGKQFPIIGGPVAGILLGLLAANIGRPESLEDGIRFTSKKVLQYAIVLIGFDMNFFHVIEVGQQSLSVIVCTIAGALLMAYIGSRFLNIRDKSSVLIGVGTCICGGSAIAAAAPCIRAKDEDIAKSISTIFLFNIIAAFLFPAMGRLMHMTDQGFGIWAGTAINDTSSVVAAATSWSQTAGNDTALTLATIVKLTRTLAIIPITLFLTFYTARKEQTDGEVSQYQLSKVFPWFVIFFLMAAILNTAFGLPPTVSKRLVSLGKFMITAAMTAIGLNTNVVKLVKSSSRSLILGMLCWFTVAAVSIIVQRAAGLW